MMNVGDFQHPSSGVKITPATSAHYLLSFTKFKHQSITAYLHEMLLTLALAQPNELTSLNGSNYKINFMKFENLK
jgi:hypothetical protein